MSEPYDLIRNTGKDYFEVEFIEWFINSIEKWATKSRKWFFQITQKADKPALEFGCITDQVVFDATASVEKREANVVKLSAFKAVHLVETENSTYVRIQTDPTAGVFYTAVTVEHRKQLREYADFVQAVIMEG